MGRKNKFREAKIRAADEALSALLRAHSSAKTRPRPVETCADLEHIYQVRINRDLHLALRAPEDWRCWLRSRAPERRFLDVVRFTFALAGGATLGKRPGLMASTGREIVRSTWKPKCARTVRPQLSPLIHHRHAGRLALQASGARGPEQGRDAPLSSRNPEGETR